MYEVSITGDFSSAHQLREYEGKCENLHGHNWFVEVTVAGNELNKTGMLIDFKELKNTLKQILQGLDHCFLNDNPPFDNLNPTAENIAFFIYDRLSDTINDPRIKVKRVKVWENKGNLAVYIGG